jgi:hypothetical protein
MGKSVIGEKCHYCRRTLYGSDFVRGLAEVGLVNTWGGEPEEEYRHTYDCENAPRRLLTREESGE